MSTTKANKASNAAASPSHPDHARWVKERTLAVEAKHAAAIGATFRDAEIVNARNLERLEARKRERAGKHLPASRPSQAKPQLTREERQKARGVTVKAAPIIKAPSSPCRFCGKCIRCKREKRVAEIMAKARIGNADVMRLAWSLSSVTLTAQLRKGRFAQLRGTDRARAFYAAVDQICDDSVKALGAWR